MLDKLFNCDSYLITTHALDAAALRHQVIANNLANVNTPGYKRQEVQFETQLANALANPCATSSGQIKPSVVTVGGTSLRADGNNVDVETEMTNLAANQFNFEVLAQSLSGYYAGLKSVINGGGGSSS